MVTQGSSRVGGASLVTSVYVYTGPKSTCDHTVYTGASWPQARELPFLGRTLFGMGVHGLTTYLRENRAAIAQTLVFSTVYDEPTPFVIDGWS